MLPAPVRGLLVAGLAVLAFGVALRGLPMNSAAMVVTEDGPYMLEPAKDCVATHDCATRLSSLGVTSRFGLPHGAAFLDLLVTVEALGGDHRSVAIVLTLLAALSAVVVLAIGARVAGPLSGLVGAYVYVHHLTVAQTYNPSATVNASLTPLPAALFVALSCAYAMTARTRYLLLAAVTLAFGVQAHLAWTVCALVPVVLVVLRGQGRRAALLAAVTLAIGASLQLLSPAMLMDTRFVASQLKAATGGLETQVAAGTASGATAVAAFGPVLGLGLMLGLTLLLGRTAPETPPERRHVLRFLLAGCLPVALVLGLLGRSGSSSYAFPAAPMIALMAAVAIGEGGERLGAGLASLVPRAALWWRDARPAALARQAAALLLALAAFGGGTWLAVEAGGRAARAGWLDQPAPSDPARRGRGELLTYDDAQFLAGRLADAGWTFEAAYTHVRGLAPPRGLVSAMAPYLPAAAAVGGERTPDPAGRDLVVLPSRAGDCLGGPPAGWSRLVAPSGAEFDIASYQPWLRWASFDACAWDAAEPGGCRWRHVEHRFAPVAADVDRRRLYARQFLGALAPDLYLGDAVLVRVPVRVPAEGAPRVVLAPSVDPGGVDGEPVCTGLVLASEGIPAEGPLPSAAVTLRPTGTPAEGALLFLWRTTAGPCRDDVKSAFPRAVVELDAASRAHVEACAAWATSPGPDAPVRPGRGPSPAEAARLLAEPHVEPLTDVLQPHVRPEPLLPLWHVWLAFGAHVLLLLAALVAVLRFVRSVAAPAPAVAVAAPAPADPGAEAER